MLTNLRVLLIRTDGTLLFNLYDGFMNHLLYVRFRKESVLGCFEGLGDDLRIEYLSWV